MRTSDLEPNMPLCVTVHRVLRRLAEEVRAAIERGDVDLSELTGREAEK
jgi:hypothetical protein